MTTSLFTPLTPWEHKPVGGVLHLERAPVRRADHEDVLRTGVVALHRSGGEVLQVDAVDLVVEVPAVPRRRSRDQHEDQRQRAPDPGRGALAGATFRSGVGRPLARIVVFAARALAASACPRCRRLVDLATELVQALLDGVSRPGPRARAGSAAASADLLAELVQALLDGVVLGIGRTHRAVFRLKTCDRTLRSTPVPPRWLRPGQPERDVSLARVAPRRGSHGSCVDRRRDGLVGNPGCKHRST